MRVSRQQFIAFSCALLLQLGLFASLAHAAEHPFHVQNDLCSSFIKFGQQDISHAAAPAAIEFKAFLFETYTEYCPSVSSSYRPAYSSRAPPVS